MNKKLIAAFLAVFLLLSFGFSAFALPSLGLGDFIDIITSIDTSRYTEFSEQEWSTMSPSERAEQINFVISDQKGSSNITSSSDFINDSNKSYDIYCYLTKIDDFDGRSSNIVGKTYLEENGLADFGMGYYSFSGGSGGNFGHSSGEFGDGTVADTLNDEFLDYLRDNPLVSDSPFHRLTSGQYTFEYSCFYSDDGLNKLVYPYVNIYQNGVLINTLKGFGYSWFGNDDYRKNQAISTYNDIVSNLYFDSDQKAVVYPARDIYFDLSPYIIDDVIELSDDPVAIGTDEDGNQIQLNINSDGVTYEGSTYNYNNDNSVTIGGKTYYISVNPSDVDDDYYKQFLGDTINNYNNYYTTEGKEFDDTDIISALKSIFSSLETFRSYCYSQLKQLYDSVRSGFSSVSRSVSLWGKNIVNAINSLGGSSDLTDEQLADYQDKLESAVNSRFGFVIGLKDILDTALSSYQNSSSSQINFKFKSRSYSIDFSTWFNDDNLNSIRFLMAAFIYLSFAFNTFRRLPSYIYNGGDR